MPDALAAEVRARLQDLAPAVLEIEDESARHAGHAGAAKGAHLRLRIVSAQFAGVPRLQRHRMVHARLAHLLAGRIHALALQLQAPGEA